MHLPAGQRETLQHETTPQCIGLPPTGSGNHRPDGPKANHALTFNMDHSSGAAQNDSAKVSRQNQATPPNGSGIIARKAVRDLVCGTLPLPGRALHSNVPRGRASGQNRANRPRLSYKYTGSRVIVEPLPGTSFMTGSGGGRTVPFLVILDRPR